MIVEDEKDLLLVIEQYLIKWGFQVEPFADPLEAPERFNQDPDAFSLALLDIRMPGMDGIHLAKEIMRIRAEVKIVMMTALELDEYICSLPTIRKHDILKKPFRLAGVCTAIKKATGAAT
jgi:DNA-binding response OmpR family regulator